MSVVRLQATIQDSDVPYLERFLKGISATDIKFEDEENYFDILSTEDLEMIAISKEQGNLGMVTKNEDVFKEIRELRERKWKQFGLIKQKKGLKKILNFGIYIMEHLLFQVKSEDNREYIEIQYFLSSKQKQLF